MVDGAVVAAAFALTFVVVPQGYGASDGATSATYNDGWQTGDNGGTGYGAWTLNAVPGWSGHFIGDSDIAVSSKSWGTWAKTSNTAEAIRSL